MHQLFYSGRPGAQHRPLAQRPQPSYLLHRAGTYRPDEGLVAAANVAILLGQPLLLTGEPGCGKTQFAYALSQELGLDRPPQPDGPVPGSGVLECFVKSTTSARELFYAFDELARFRDGQARLARPLQSYLSFNGLGRAILLAGGPDCALQQLPGLAFESAAGAAQAAGRPRLFGDLYPRDAFAPLPTATVVLIDELDKAPRDTPNDMLNEIERLGFDIPELGVRVQVPNDPATRPVIVVTSNSEKSLPEPFLRRCVYYDIPFPEQALREIAYAQVKGLPVASGLIDEALSLFDRLRDRTRIQRPPGTAELLAWLDTLLGEDLPPDAALRAVLQPLLAAPDPADPAQVQARRLEHSTLSVLIKRTEDRAGATALLHDWVAGR